MVHRTPAVAALVLLAADYLALQLFAIPRAKLSADALLREDPLSMTAVARAVLPIVMPFALMGLLAVVVLVVIEVRTGWLRARVRALADAPSAARWTTLAICGVLATAILAPGSMVRSDSLTHVLRAQYLLDVVSRGELPLWAPHWYGGYPFGQFYSPLTSLLVALAGLPFGVNFGAKLVLFAAHLAGCWGMYRLVWRCTRRPLPAAMAALAFGVMRSHLAVVFFHGSFPGGVVLALLPFLFLAGDALARDPGARRTITLAVALAAVTAAHPAFLRPLALPWLGWLAFAVVSAHTTASSGARAAARLVLAHVLALGLCAYLVVPLVLEKHLVHFPRAFALLPLPPASGIARVFVWSPFHPAFQGIVVSAMAALPVLAAWRRTRSAGLVLVPAVAAVYVLWWPEERSHHVIGFVLALCAGLGLHVFHLDRRPKLVLLLAAALIVEHGLFWAMNTYEIHPSPEGATDAQLAALLESSHDPTRRVLAATQQGGRLQFDIWHLFHDLSIPSLMGPFKQGVPRTYEPTGHLVHYTAQGLNRSGTLDETVRAGLALSNVGLLSFERGSESLLHAVPLGARLEVDPPVLILPHASSLWFFDEVRAPSDLALPPATPRPRWDGWDPQADYAATMAVVVLRAMQLVPEECRGRALFAAEAESTSPVETAPTGPALRTIATERHRQGVRHQFETTRAGYVRLSQNAYPHATLRVDGAITQPSTDLLGAPFVFVTTGPHEIVWEPRLSPLRRRCAMVSLVCALALAVAWMRLRDPS